MSNKKIIVRNKVSSPPTNDQLDYLHKKKIQIMETRGLGSSRRIVVRISGSAFVLCDPEEEEKYKRLTPSSSVL